MKIFALVYKIVFLTILAPALWMELFGGGVFRGDALRYFTIQSNILTFLAVALSLPPALRKSRIQSFVAGLAFMAITVTGLVYNFILFNIFIDWGTGAYVYARTVTHLTGPLLYILFWIFFQHHGKIKGWYILLWALYPLIYGFISLYANHKTGFYLYPFLNVAGGFAANMGTIAFVLCVVLVLCAIVYRMDKIMGRRNRYWMFRS